MVEAIPSLICINFACVILLGCKVINDNNNKTMKMNPVKKKMPKQVQAILKNGIGPKKN